MPSTRATALKLSGWAESLPVDDNTRFILDRTVPEQDSDCWMWMGHIKSNGYGRLSVNRKQLHAHRFAFFVFNGRHPAPSMDVCHRCDNRGCVNPAHLFEGTRKDNMQDAVAKGRTAKGMRLPQTKVTSSMASEIVSLAKAGVDYESVAKLFGITKQHAGFIAIQQGVRRRGIRK